MRKVLRGPLVETVTILSVHDARWDDVIAAIPSADVYYERGYCQAGAQGDAELFVFQRNQGTVILPYIRIPSPIAGLFDAISPYGYSGPISNAQSERLWQDSALAFDDYCRGAGIVTTFHRFHPLLETHMNWGSLVKPCFLRHTCFIDLQEKDAIMRNMTSKCRNMVRKGCAHGLRMEIVGWGEGGHVFLPLYTGTMQRLGAHAPYFFSEAYFASLAGSLSEAPWVAIVYQSDVPCAAALLLRRRPFIHYHLAGWDVHFRNSAPNNFMLYQIALHAESEGYRLMHLGGGYAGDDDLFVFKAQFNMSGVRKFYVGEQIHLQREFAALCEMSGTDAQGDFFPPYRRKRA